MIGTFKRIASFLCAAFCLGNSWAGEPDSQTAQSEQNAMTRVSSAFKSGAYDEAVVLLQQLMHSENALKRQEAHELLGLAWERRGSIEVAKKVYANYLELYPDGPGAVRVKQRLAGLVTASWSAAPGAKKTRNPRQGWETVGAFSQYLRRDAFTTISRSSLISTLDLNSRGRYSRYNFKTRFNGNYYYDLSDENSNDISRLSTLYVDFEDSVNEFSGRMGRQRAYGGGVLGRFDGLSLDYRLLDRLTLKAVSGYPVERTSVTSPDTGRKLYGGSVDVGIGEAWTVSGYMMRQTAETLLDRRAVGMETRYARNSDYLFSVVDYDLAFDALNIVSLQASRTLSKTTLNASFDYRTTPILTVRNALIGQSTTSLATLAEDYDEGELMGLARDRTGRSYMAMLGIAQVLTKSLRADADVTVTKYSATASSAGVMGVVASDYEYFSTLRLVANDWLTSGTIGSVALRMAKLSYGNNYRLMFDTRLPYFYGLRVNPLFSVGYRTRNSLQPQWNVAPGLRFDYRYGKRALIEFDALADWVRTEWQGVPQIDRVYSMNLGYRITF